MDRANFDSDWICFDEGENLMTNEEILQKALEKIHGHALPSGKDKFAIIGWDSLRMDLPNWIKDFNYRIIIFDHRFALAFWKCQHTKLYSYTHGSFMERCRECGQTNLIGQKWPTYEDHLKNMVIEVEPLKYIQRFL